MGNLLNSLSKELQLKLKDFKVSSITIEYNEVNTVSRYCLDSSYLFAIEMGLIELGYEINLLI